MPSFKKVKSFKNNKDKIVHGNHCPVVKKTLTLFEMISIYYKCSYNHFEYSYNMI